MDLGEILKFPPPVPNVFGVRAMLGRFSANMGGTTARFLILPQIPDPIVSTQRLPMRGDRILSTQGLPMREYRILSTQRVLSLEDWTLSTQRCVARAEMNVST